MSVAWLYVLLCLLLSAFFSATEIAFLSVNRLHITLLTRKGKLAGKLISGFLANSAQFITTILIGNTVALVLYGIFMAELLNPVIEGWLYEYFKLSAGTQSLALLVIQTVMATILVLLTAEFLPKSLSLINPDVFMQVAAFPMSIIYRVLFPLVWLVVKFTNVGMRTFFGIEAEKKKFALGLSDLSHYIVHTQITNEKFGEQPELVNAKIFGNALEFDKVKVRDCMIPRKEIIAIELTDGIEELKQTFEDSGHSKIPVYEESIDNIVGYCHMHHLFRQPETLAEIVTEIIIVPETMLASELMVKFIADHKSMALVVDEYGGTSGIITIEDIIEEIFGDIEDEHDEDELVFRELGDNTYEISGRHEIDDLNEEHKLYIPEGDYDTLGGFITELNKDIPQVNDVVENEQFKFVVKSMMGARIDLVQVELLQPVEAKDE
jgi:CBS domain containing-hemolysin-like protein